MLLLMAASFLPFPTSVLAGAPNSSDRAERIAIAFYGATALWIEQHRRGWFRALAYPAAIAFGIIAFPKAAAIVYLVVAAQGVLDVANDGQFSLQRLFRRA